LIDRGFQQVVFLAEGDDEVDFMRFVVGEAEVREFAGLVEGGDCAEEG
jgi:hypothetical protein